MFRGAEAVVEDVGTRSGDRWFLLLGETCAVK